MLCIFSERATSVGEKKEGMPCGGQSIIILKNQIHKLNPLKARAKMKLPECHPNKIKLQEQIKDRRVSCVKHSNDKQATTVVWVPNINRQDKPTLFVSAEVIDPQAQCGMSALH